MNFRETESYLFSLGNEVSAMKLGLENIRTLLAALGEPHEKYLKVQVAGTNGKGSVCAFLDSICRSARIETGLYTSPHLISITERIKINGIDIDRSEFARIATVVRDTAEQLLARGKLEYRPTFFEQTTAIALVAFAEAKVELAILETGLGGRLDATTAANAEIAAITRIDLDHQEYLGETIEEIAGEKAAVIHVGSKVVIGEQPQGAMPVLLARCRELDIIPQAASKMHIWQLERSSGKATASEFDVNPSVELGVVPGLAGRHQIENAYTAIMIAGTLVNDFDVEISEEQIRLGLVNAHHPGRLEYQGRYLFDGAHNIGGANALAEYLREFETRRITLIFGAMRGKNVLEILEILVPLAQRLIVTEPSNSRSFSSEELIEQLPVDISKEKIFATENVESAIKLANKVTPDNGIILVTGSLYLVGEVKKILNN